MHFIREGVSQGAKLLTGGDRPAELPTGSVCVSCRSHACNRADVPLCRTCSYYVQPTVFVDVNPDMTIWREEIFGPVLSVRKFTSEDEAVALANDSIYGLGVSILHSVCGFLWPGRVSSCWEGGVFSFVQRVR